jgi:UrcA family protein
MNTAFKNQSKSIASIVAASLVVLGWVATAGSAHAGEIEDALTKTVAYGDLNLDTEAGARTLFFRLRSAAKQVCSPLAGRSLSLQSRWQACYDKAVASAVAQVNHTAVTAVYASSIGRSPKG